MEYALVLAAFLAVVAGLGALMRLGQEGVLVQHALASASHHVQASAGWLADVFAF